MGMKWRDIKQVVLLLGFAVTLVGSGFFACSVSNPEEEDEGGGDADSDSDSDGDADEDPACIATISGKVVYGDDAAMKDVPFQICAPDCQEVIADNDGKFEVSVVGDVDQVGQDTDSSSDGDDDDDNDSSDDDDDDNDDDNDDDVDGCRYYNFSNPRDFIRVALGQPDPLSADTHAEYVVHFEPTDKDVSGGDYDLGKLQLHKLNGDSEKYTALDGATVDMKGVSYSLVPGALEEWVFDSVAGQMVMQPIEKADLRVFKASLDDGKPPFNYLGLDALYYLGPYWTKVKNYGVVLSIEAPGGEPDGTTGTLYMLSNDSPKGGLAYFDGLRHCVWVDNSSDHYAESALANCGQVVVIEGKVVTPPVPILGWVGIIMDEPDTEE
jgi:hypothetical protein